MTKKGKGSTVPEKKICPFCNGDGKLILVGELVKCKICKGTGLV